MNKKNIFELIPKHVRRIEQYDTSGRPQYILALDTQFRASAAYVLWFIMCEMESPDDLQYLTS